MARIHNKIRGVRIKTRVKNSEWKDFQEPQNRTPLPMPQQNVFPEFPELSVNTADQARAIALSKNASQI